ncbi:helix-turn-helix domain-containing protein, partial [Alloyangia mangrovi]|uniref:helix-turn-helix domain-containing protein n=1 Tax=Alloyangia mangrovi TaxID=1779329 RepID=UPI0021A8D81D
MIRYHDFSKDFTKAPGLPAWVPEIARLYLAHTEDGEGIRALARSAGCHASTVLRQVRRMETLRDDPLVDEALRRLGAARAASAAPARGGADDAARGRSRRGTQWRPEPGCGELPR